MLSLLPFFFFSTVACLNHVDQLPVTRRITGIECEPPAFQGIGFSQGQSLPQTSHVSPWPWAAYQVSSMKEEQSVPPVCTLLPVPSRPDPQSKAGRLIRCAHPTGGCAGVNLTPWLVQWRPKHQAHIPSCHPSTSGHVLASICGSML